MSEKIGENKCSICGMPIEPYSVSGGLCYQCKKLEKKKAMTTAEFLKYYDVGEPSNSVFFKDIDDFIYKYAPIDILSDAKIMLEERDKRIKELEVYQNIIEYQISIICPYCKNKIIDNSNDKIIDSCNNGFCILYKIKDEIAQKALENK